MVFAHYILHSLSLDNNLTRTALSHIYTYNLLKNSLSLSVFQFPYENSHMQINCGNPGCNHTLITEVLFEIIVEQSLQNGC